MTCTTASSSANASLRPSGDSAKATSSACISSVYSHVESNSPEAAFLLCRLASLTVTNRFPSRAQSPVVKMNSSRLPNVRSCLGYEAWEEQGAAHTCTAVASTEARNRPQGDQETHSTGSVWPPYTNRCAPGHQLF